MSSLKKHFPMIREREEVLADIEGNKELRNTFYKWTEKQQMEFLDICTGIKGMKILSDSIFKEVSNPEYAPERMNDFLSAIYKQKVKILRVLPNDSVRIATEGTLLITDLVVQLEDGSIVNVEVQRIGYKFPGERAACYSADLLLRQYKRVRDQRGKRFFYKDIKPVYTIVLFEQSPQEFKQFPDKYIHYMEQKSDTGLELNLLQKYVFISLDIFKQKRHNEPIKDELEAWLTFFSTEDPESIERLITAYPKFKKIYETIYDICLNTERVMGMFSKELQILDENTVQYMIDEMQAIIDYQKGTIENNEKVLAEMDRVIEEKDKVLEEKDKVLEEKDKVLGEKEKILGEKERILGEKNLRIEQLIKQLELAGIQPE